MICSLLRTLLLLTVLPLVAASATAQWSANPALNLSVGDGQGDQVLPKIATTPGGRTWIGWFDTATGNHDVRLQLLDEAGVEMFPHNGLLVSAHPSNPSLGDWDLLADSSGACVLVFSDARAGSDLDIHAYRIDGGGAFLWGPDGVALSANDDYEPSPKGIESSEGSFVFVWPRLPGTGPGELLMQKLDVGGTKLLGAQGIAIPAQGTEKPAFCELVASDHGAWIVGWVRDITSFSSPRHIRAQKFAASGAPLWPTPVAVLDAGPVPIAYQPVVQSDGEGGALFAWHRAPASLFDCHVQRLDATGAELFAHNGVRCSTKPNRNKIGPTLSYAPTSGEMLVFWNERNAAQSQWGISGQKISPAGARMWGDEGLELLPLDGVVKSEPVSVPFGTGAELFYLDQPHTPLPDARVLALRVDNAGQTLWGGAPVVLCASLSWKDDLEASRDAAGGAQLAWEDERVDGGDVLAQNVHPDGTLGLSSGCSLSSYCVTSPNSVGPGARIGADGSVSIGLNAFTLRCWNLPAGQPGLFYTGDARAQVPFGGGVRCAGGTIVRLVPASVAGLDGTVVRALDFSQLPAQGIAPGSSWNFQFWYRDPAGPPPSLFNLSDGLAVTFCP